MGDNCQIFSIIQIDLKCKKNAERFIKNFAKFTGLIGVADLYSPIHTDNTKLISVANLIV